MAEIGGSLKARRGEQGETAPFSFVEGMLIYNQS